MGKEASFTELAYSILKSKGKPMHYKEITEEALRVKLVAGKTPAQTLRAAMAKDSRFKKLDRGMYGLAEWAN